MFAPMGDQFPNCPRELWQLVGPRGDSHVGRTLHLGAFFHHQNRRMDFTDEHSGLEQLHALDCRHGGLDAAAAHDGTRRDNALHQSIFADNDLTLRVNFTFKTAVDSNRAFDANLALEMHALGQERNVVIATKAVFLHAGPPSTNGASLHYFGPHHLGDCGKRDQENPKVCRSRSQSPPPWTSQYTVGSVPSMKTSST